MCLTSMYCLQCYSELTERHFNPSSSALQQEGKEMKRAVYPLYKWMMMIITIIEYVCLLLLFLDCRLLGVFFS